MHIEGKDQMAPLAARILAILILTGKQGTTFDSLVHELGASKSTISTHLTTLQTANRITYYTKSGDRKKYFTLIPDVMIKTMSDMLEMWRSEQELHEEIMAYKQEKNKTIAKDSEEYFELEFHTEYLEYLGQARASIEKLKKRLIEKHKND